MTSVEDQIKILTAGTVDVISEADLRKKLSVGKPLRVKLGIDPTASDIHLGFTVVLRKLRQFQDLGHTAVLIIGDFTAQVGDPTGRSVTRPPLTQEQVDAHAATYVEQVQSILDFTPGRIEIVRNSEWLSKIDMAGVLRLMSQTTLARILERDDFTKRYQEGSPISLSELVYPLMQGWDSVQVRADVELGGTDQLFNNLMGRQLQVAEGQAPQVVITTPLLEGLDGVKKMSKSLGNYIGIAEAPGEQFGKLMSIPDALMPRYFALTTGWLPERVAAIVASIESGELAPVAAKRLLARTIVDLYHGEGAGKSAEDEFDRIFKDGSAPTDVQEFVIKSGEFPITLARLLATAGLATSNKEGRRKIEQGGVRIEGEKVTDPDVEVTVDEINGKLLQLGKRAWARVIVS
ncbi:MAG: tyrosine--tRNA ligase [Actinobacteria bacterium]|nr:tyrosine--tRNA ligase [Actinomycetota bacterium]